MSAGHAAGKAVLIDGVLCAPDAAKVSVYDRGFLFGDAVFEVLRTYGKTSEVTGEMELVRLPLEGIDVPIVDRAIGIAGGPEPTLACPRDALDTGKSDGAGAVEVRLIRSSRRVL